MLCSSWQELRTNILLPRDWVLLDGFRVGAFFIVESGSKWAQSKDGAVEHENIYTCTS